jgi:Spy/CpxP family protein refolding chaperone
MKRIVTSALAIVLFIGAANAQTKEKNKDHKGRKHGHEMTMKKADLTVEQQNQVKNINENYRKQVADLKAQNLSEDQLKTKKEALHKQHKADLQAVLTSDQKVKISNAHKEWKDKGRRMNNDSAGKDHHRNIGAKDGKEKQMAAELNLTAEQQEKMKTIRSTYKPKMQALRNDASLTPEQKKEKIKELMNQQKEEMKTVLSEEQQEKMKSMRKDQMKRTK